MIYVLSVTGECVLCCGVAGGGGVCFVSALDTKYVDKHFPYIYHRYMVCLHPNHGLFIKLSTVLCDEK